MARTTWISYANGSSTCSTFPRQHSRLPSRHQHRRGPLPEDGYNPAHLQILADRAMYAAKRSGGNRWQIA
jgi:hypothetical protein